MAKTLDACHKAGLLKYIIPNVDEILSSKDRDKYLNILTERRYFYKQGWNSFESLLASSFSLSLCGKMS